MEIPNRSFCSSIYKLELFSNTPPTWFFGLFFLLYHSILSYIFLPSSDPVLSLHSFSSILSLCWILLQTLASPFLSPNPRPISTSCFECFSSTSSWLPVILVVLRQPSCLPSQVLHNPSAVTEEKVQLHLHHCGLQHVVSHGAMARAPR